MVINMGNASTTGGSRARQGSGEEGPTIGIKKDFDISGSLNDSNEFPAGTFRTAHRNISETSTRIRSISLSQGPTPAEISARTELPVVFKWDQHGAKSVSLSGSFDNWKTKYPLHKTSHDEWYTIINLRLGSHQYKFLVDGQWLCNPNEPTVCNAYNTCDNKLTIKPSDYNVFLALKADEAIVKKEREARGFMGGSGGPGGPSGGGPIRGAAASTSSGISGSPPGDYGQLIPPRATGFGFHSGPPILPPHLLQVILNKEIPMHCEPTLLPEPNHVMLNHLYALSIKDGVMVLSSTHRYRKKYVTTLLYKPI